MSTYSSSAQTGITLSRGSGLGVNIIEVLKAYQKSLPVDFLASVLGRERTEILNELDILAQRGAIHREGDNVKLA